MNVLDESSQLLLLGAVWALVLLVLYLVLPRLVPRNALSTRQALLIIGVVGLMVRLIPNVILPMGAGYDIESYQVVGSLVSRGEQVYQNPDTEKRHPYLPFQMYWMAFSYRAAASGDLPFVKVVRLAPIGADVAISLLLYQFVRRSKHPREALYAGLAYAINPIPVLVSAYHGQFDAIPALTVVLALVMLDRSPLTAGGWLGLGILDKSWPMLAFPSLLMGMRAWRQRLPFVVAMVSVPVLGVAVYVWLFHADYWAVVERALGYNWGIGVWGYTYFIRLLSILAPKTVSLFRWVILNGRYLTLGALSIIWFLRARKETPENSLLTVMVAFLAVTHAFSIQYLVWIVPIAVLNGQQQWLVRYTLGAFAYMFLAYTTLILAMNITELLPWPQADWYIIMPAGIPAWLVLVGWTRSRLFKGR